VGGPKCYSCGEEGHTKAACPREVKLPHCVFCKSGEHVVEDCEKRKESTCKECKKKGHSAGFHKEKFCDKCRKTHSGLNGCGG
jgi:hypothetical protein